MIYTARVKTSKVKICLACPDAEKEKPVKEFYISKNPLHGDNRIPWCKSCIKRLSLTDEGEINEEKFKSVLRQIDRPYYKDLLQSSINQYKKEHSYISDDDVRYHGDDIIGLYFKNINTLRQTASKSYGDSERDGFFQKKSGSAAELGISKTIKQKEKDKYTFDVGDFKVTDEVIQLFGSGYDIEQYKKMYDKFESLKKNYPLYTTLHIENLVTYVRFKVKEEEATARGDVDAAKKWNDAAQSAAEKGKLTPKQLTKADLDGGISSVSELVKAIEQTTDVIKILPRFKYRPNDAPDFNIFCYVNYERKLNGQPPVSYEDIYAFYDKKKEEYIKQNGDPYGIFENDTAEKNRETVKTFITLPDNYDELAGAENED